MVANQSAKIVNLFNNLFFRAFRFAVNDEYLANPAFVWNLADEEV